MSNKRGLIVGLICALVAAPASAKAQATDTTRQASQNLVGDLVRGLVGPNWNLFAHGGITTGERYLLEQAVDPTAGQRSLQTAAGYNVGGGAGVDVMMGLGLRATYTFTSSNMNFRTDNGNGSGALNVNDVARLKSSTISVEALKYMLTSRAPISPYGSLGIQCTWWSLDEKSPLVTAAGAGTPFGVSPLFTFGVQVKAASHWSARVEAVLASGRNPFTGSKAFQSTAGPAIDEPTSINSTTFRLAAVYHFGSPKVTAATPSMAQ